MTKKLLTFLTLLTLFFGVGWAETAVYSLTIETNSATNSSDYTKSWDFNISGITWNVTGNTNMNPWRIGGKNIENVDREIFSKTPMGSPITKINVEFGTVDNITVNSATLIVSSDANFTNVLDNVSFNVTANSTVTILPSSNVTEWANNAYYKFVFNVTNTNTKTNYFIQFKGAKFYYDEGSQSSVATPTITLNPASGPYYVGDEVTASITCGTEGAAISYQIDGGAWTAYSGGDITIPSTTAGDVTITAKAAKDGEEAISDDMTVTFSTIATASTVADILDLTDGTTFKFTGNLVVSGKSGNQLYAQDATGGIHFYGSTPSYSFEDKIPAGFIAKYVADYNGAPELTTMSRMKDPTAPSGELTAVTLTPSQVTQNNPFIYAVIKNATVTGTGNSAQISANGQTVPLQNTFGLEDIHSGEGAYDIYGVTNWNNGAKFLPLEFVAHEGDYTITVTQPAEGGEISASPLKADEGDEITLTATPAAGYKFTSWTVTDNDGAITVTDNKFTVRTSNVTVTATFSKVSDLYIIGNVNGIDVEKWHANQGVKMSFIDGVYTADIWVTGKWNGDMQKNAGTFAFFTVLAENNDEGSWGYVNGNRYEPDVRNINNPDEQIGSSHWWLANNVNSVNTNVTLLKRNWNDDFLIPAGLYTVTVSEDLTKFNLTVIKDITPTITPDAGEVAAGTNATIALSEDFNTFIANCPKVLECTHGDNGSVYTPLNLTLPEVKLYVNDQAVEGTSSEYTFSANQSPVTITGKGALLLNGSEITSATKTATAQYTVHQESNQYERTTSIVTNKKYLIAYEGEELIMGANSGGKNASISTGFTMNEGLVTVTDASNGIEYVWFESDDNGNYRMKNANGEYYTVATSGTNLSTGTTPVSVYITFSGNDAKIAGTENGSRQIGLNTGVTPRVFGAYSNPGSSSQQKLIQLYKQTEGTVTPTCAKPTFSPAGGTYAGAQNVTISCTTEGATIMYKTTEMDNYAQYTTAVPITVSTTLTAYASKDGYIDSEPASAAYTITTPKVATPVFTPGEGVYTTAQNVTITCATEDATISYKVNNGEWTAYTTGTTIEVSEPTTLYAKATKADYDDSEIAEANYSFMAPGSGQFVLVTKQSDIVAGREYVIVSKDHSKVMGTIGSQDYGTPLTGSNFNDDYSRMTPAEGANVLTLGGSEGAWTLQQKSGNYVWLQIGGTNIYSKPSTYTQTDKYCMQLAITFNAEDGTTAITETKSTNSTRQIGFNGSSKFGHWANSNYTQTNTSYQKVYLYYKSDVELKTLAQIETSGVVGKDYTISDQLIAVHLVQPTSQSNPYYYLWCKDQGNASICKTEAKEVDGVMQTDYMKDVLKAQSGDWDQSNWVVLIFDPSTQEDMNSITGAVNHYINAGSITGTYTDDVNYTITMPEGEGLVGKVGDALSTPYVPNVYCTANFLDANLNINGGNGPVGAESGKHYFFMNPKVNEVATITQAVWYSDSEGTNKYFVIAKKEDGNNAADFNGAFSVDWTYNSDGDVSDNLVVGYIYKFKAVLNIVPSKAPMRDGDDEEEPTTVTPKPCTPDAGKTVQALDLSGGDDNIVTAVADVNSSKTVAGVKYYNLAGMASDKPFDGVNIIVTTYTDGSRSSAKVLR